MRNPLLIRTACALLLFACPGAWAGSTLAEHRLVIPERGEVPAYLFSIDTNHFSFLAPPGWRTSSRPDSRTIVIISEDLAQSITVEFLKNDPAEPGARQRANRFVRDRYPDARIRETFTCRTGLGKGRVFDLKRSAADKVRLSSRVVYVSRDWGTVEFALTTPQAKSAESLPIFENLVNSFQRPVR